MSLTWTASQGLDLFAFGGLDDAILRTLVYADIFDYPLTMPELHRYLHGISADRQTLEAALAALLETGAVGQQSGFYHLPGRTHVVPGRIARRDNTGRIWPHILLSGQLIAALPFVRMVALTGSHAMRNADEKADLDVMLVTAHGRLWLCRAFVILLARLVSLRGPTICPNLIISERALAFPVRNIYTAHELAQMIPLAGLAVYDDIRAANPWCTAYLPNAATPPHYVACDAHALSQVRTLAEAALRLSVWNAVERWEMRRKIRCFNAEGQSSGEARFSPDWCQGHFDEHGSRTLAIYKSRLERIGLAVEDGMP